MGKIMFLFLLILILEVVGNLAAPNPCLPNWTHLARSKLCIKLENGTFFYNASIRFCLGVLEIDQSLISPVLLSLESLYEDDFLTLDNTVGSKVNEVWTYVDQASCIYSKRSNNTSWLLYTNHNCSNSINALPLVCQMPSLTDPIDFSSFQSRQFLASSSFVQEGTFNLMEFKPSYAVFGKSFKKGLFKGSGWCSKTLSSGSEFLEINVDGKFVLSGFAIQHGTIKDCHIWMSKFTLLLMNNNRWSNKTYSNYKLIFESPTKESTFWFDFPEIVERIQIVPLEKQTSCVVFDPPSFCLRLTVYGYYLEHDLSKYVLQQEPELQQDSYTKHVSGITQQWPSGTYVLPMTSNDCSGSFNGEVSPGYQMRKSINRTLNFLNSSRLSIQVEGNVLRENICIHETNSLHQNFSHFPPGNYCVIKYGQHECPSSFTETQITEEHYEFGKYYLPTTLYEESVMFTNSSVANATRLVYCCRNDASEEPSMFPFTVPFVLIPTSDHCNAVQNASVIMETFNVSFNANSSSSVFVLKYCIYEPVNNADLIVLSSVNGALMKNANFPFQVSVQIKSNGYFATSGVDTEKEFFVSLQGANCKINHENLHAGKALVTLSKCTEGNLTLTVHLKTHLGKNLTNQINLTLQKEYIALLLGHSSILNPIQFLQSKNGSMEIKEFGSNAELYNALSNRLEIDKTYLGQIHLLVVLEQQDTELGIVSFTQTYGVPTIVFNLLTQSKNIPDETTKYVSTPEFSNFYFALMDNRVQANKNVVIIRTENTVSYSGFYSIFRANLNLQKDIIVPQNGAGIRQYLSTIHKNVTIFIFLDSHRASLVLREAIKLGITPDNGYLWISFSAKFVISNSFMRPACMDFSPPCHVVFKNMWHIFHVDEALGCERNDEVLGRLKQEVTNITDVMYNHLVPIVIEDLKKVVDDMLASATNNNTPFTKDLFLNYTSTISCLPSRSGLKLVPKILYDKSQFPYIDYICQPGWSGATCNIPFCTKVSCNQTHGTCIAPELCKCNPGRYGRNCNGDCSRTCVNGVCNEGMFGDGTCASCDWLYLGEYCDEKTIIYGFVAAGIGTSICGVFLLLYVIRLLQTQEQNAVAEIEAAEKDYSMNWNDLETVEDVDYQTKVARKQLINKMEYTSYKRGVTFSGQHVFIKCIEKPHFQITFQIKDELQQLCQLSHNNIEQLIGIIVGHPRIGVVTPIANMGSLFDVLHEKNILITWDVRYSIMQDICQGMSYLHDVAKIKHGRLKSTNCVIYQGWQIKIGDIGLRMVKARKREKRQETKTVTKYSKYQNDGEIDFKSLLWTAPELTCSGATNVDQIIRYTAKADVYSFGIIISEIISRQPPYSDITVMSIDHIVQAVAHLREPIISLDQMNTTQENDKNESDLLRPTVHENLYPSNESESSIMKMLMESCWAESPTDRPPFAYSLEVLKLITPLKGSQLSKRAVLLERESESLEKYIGHDTQQIFHEKDKFDDLITRILPPTVAMSLISDGSVKPTMHNNVTVLVMSVYDIDKVVSASSASQAVDLISYLWKAINVTIKSRNLKVSELNNRGDVMIFGGGFHSSNNRHPYELSLLATSIIKTMKSVKMSSCPANDISLQAGIHTGQCISGLTMSSGSANYTLIGEAIECASILEKDSLPNQVHASKKTTVNLNGSEFDIVSRTSYKAKTDKQVLRTCWISLR